MYETLLYKAAGRVATITAGASKRPEDLDRD